MLGILYTINCMLGDLNPLQKILLKMIISYIASAPQYQRHDWAIDTKAVGLRGPMLEPTPHSLSQAE